MYCNIMKINIKKSKKPHTCEECKKVIIKGKSYTHVKLNYGDGYWIDYRFHNKCINKSKKIRKAEQLNKKAQRDYIASIKYPKIKKLIPKDIYILEKSEMRKILNKIQEIINEK